MSRSPAPSECPGGPKIVIATFGSLGDLNPYVALAHALRSEGFAPLLATSETYRAFVEGEGLGFAPMRPDVFDLTSRLGLGVAEIAERAARDDGYLFRETIFPFLRDAYEDVVAASEGAAAIVAHSIAFAAKLAAERLELPLFDGVVSPLFLMSARDPPRGARSPFIAAPRSAPALAYNRCVLSALIHLAALRARPIARLRAELGLPPRRGRALLTGGFYAKATLALVSPLLASPQPDHPPNTLVAGHTFHDRFLGGAEALPAELEAFLAEGPPPIVVSLGSFVLGGKADFHRAAASAALALGRRAVLLVAEEERDGLSAGLPSGAFVAGHVPHSLLLPRACAVLHHGGAGSSGQALRAGKPQLVLPVLGDQPDNAARLARLGVARVLPLKLASRARLEAELRALIGDAALAERAREVGARVAGEDGAARAARRIADCLERDGRGASKKFAAAR
jgi:UDP:flavonoid glycosyltransferase YjiC (YdhE family)